MIRSVEEAWAWYNSVRRLAAWMSRLAERYWDSAELAELLSRDNHFRDVAREEIEERVKLIEEDLDDLGVLLLFSVFETQVRERVMRDVSAEMPTASHPALKLALEELMEALAQGSFAKVLAPYKGKVADLTEQVSQVRRYRNWVAHGRQEDRQPATVTPEVARERLRVFLERLAVAEPPTDEG